jgi:hypothetical protein
VQISTNGATLPFVEWKSPRFFQHPEPIVITDLTSAPNMKTRKFYNRKRETCGQCFTIRAMVALVVFGSLVRSMRTKRCEECSWYQYGYTHCEQPIEMALDEYEGCMENFRVTAIFCTVFETLLAYSDLPQTDVVCDDLWAWKNVSRCENVYCLVLLTPP